MSVLRVCSLSFPFLMVFLFVFVSGCPRRILQLDYCMLYNNVLGMFVDKYV